MQSIIVVIAMLISMIRTIVIYFLVVLALRFMGKRQIGELEPTELVVTILISNIASLPMQETSIPLINGIIPILILLSLEIFMSCIMLKMQSLKKLIAGKSLLVIDKGTILQNELKRARYTIEDLMQSLRQMNIFDINEVQYAIIETNGRLSVMKKPPYQEVTAQMLNLQPENAELPRMVIIDGVISKKALGECNLNEKWLYNVLGQKRLKPGDVFMMTVINKNSYNIIKKEKQK